MTFRVQRAPIEPHALAQQIVMEHRFHIHARAAALQRTWWDVVLGWLGQRWNALIALFNAHIHLRNGSAVVIGDVILTIIAVLVAIVLVRLFANSVRDMPVAAAVAPARPAVRAAELYANSVQKAGNGDYAAAVALLFRAAVVALDVRGVVRDRPSFTVNEWRTAVRRRSAGLSRPFDELARIFTHVLYAEQPVTADQWTQARDAYAAIVDGR